LKTKEQLETISFDTLLSQAEVYNPVSGDRIPTSGINMYIKSYIVQGCHILTLWKQRGLLESKKTVLNVNGTILEMETSKGGHVILDKNEGWIFNTSTFIIALLIDFYQIDGEMPNAQLNFSNDAEYRFKVASYLYNVLRAFCVNNIDGRKDATTVEEVVQGCISIVS
jgi:hypothetical protein